MTWKNERPISVRSFHASRLADDCEYPAREGDPIVAVIAIVTLTATGGAVHGLAHGVLDADHGRIYARGKLRVSAQTLKPMLGNRY